jgi:hypothetical protein
MTEGMREGGAAIVGVDTAQGACKTGVTRESGSVPLYGAHGRMASEHEGEGAVGIKVGGCEGSKVGSR